MKTLKSNQYGFHAVEFVLIAVVVIGLGFAGWRVYEANNTDEAPVVTEQQVDAQTQLDSTEAPEINSTEDLDEAEAILNELESNEVLNESQFDEDVDELL